MGLSNRQLSEMELAQANSVLAIVRNHIQELCGGDDEPRFAYNRKISKEMVYEPVPIFRTCDYTAIGSCDSYRSGLR